MGKTLLKPRWETWENECIQSAFSHKIQYKIMAVALGRSFFSVSKRIKILGLKKPASLDKRRSPSVLTQAEKLPHDLTKMTEILKIFAPLKCFQEGQLALEKACWVQAPPLVNEKPEDSSIAFLEDRNISYSFVKALEFIPAHIPFSGEKRFNKIQRDPAYLPLYYIEQWAEAEGFHKTSGPLSQQGLSYWKEGSYYSQTQLLMYVNRLRFQYHLQPIALMEEGLAP